ncbi:hypothetical protein CSA56_07245 [candidate division KSB3 bacterium]|uniref:Glycosyl transferase family 1 domain-containing protein n=1 Tax=candidate division KSB3 bacterium TaxID=2044937 RepID=A0A2G6KHZ3_9BACT|nr:MAG: hypothetical protein CSA56_07245 [candidate division KSB3 bacterium]
MKNSVLFSVGVPLPGAGMGNHAYYLVQGLFRHHLLKQALVLQYHDIDDALSEHIRTFYLAERIAYRLTRYIHTDQYVLRDNLFDAWVSRYVKDAAVFYGWTHHALWSLKAAKRQKMMTVLERANSHPLTYSRLLDEEYTRRGIRKAAYHPLILKKHLRELKETDYIAVTSQFTKDSLLEHGIDEQRILLTPLGVNTDYFIPRNMSQGESIFRVVYVGQICVRKGIHYLLEAWDKLQLHNAELLLVGDLVSEMTETVTQVCKKNDSVRVLPHTADPRSLYQAASVCILPTLEDGFGLVVLEAMACGVPVIVTEHTGAKDCVRPECDGFVIPPYDVKSIADMLSYCHTHRSQLQTMGIQARQQAEQFSWTHYQDGIVRQLQQLL